MFLRLETFFALGVRRFSPFLFGTRGAVVLRVYSLSHEAHTANGSLVERLFRLRESPSASPYAPPGISLYCLISQLSLPPFIFHFIVRL